MDVGRGHDYGMSDLRFCCRHRTGLYLLHGVHANKPWVAFLGLIHVRVTFPLFVLGR